MPEEFPSSGAPATGPRARNLEKSFLVETVHCHDADLQTRHKNQAGYVGDYRVRGSACILVHQTSAQAGVFV